MLVVLVWCIRGFVGPYGGYDASISLEDYCGFTFKNVVKSMILDPRMKYPIPDRFLMSFIKLSGKTVNRAFRIDTALDEELEREAEKNRTTVSNLLLQLTNWYLNFHRYNLYRNYINMGNNTLKTILEYIDEDRLYPCGFEMGTENPVSRVFRAGMKPGEESLRIYLQILDAYANWFEFDEKEINGKTFLYISHNHGPLWTRFLEGYFDGAFEKLEIRANIEKHGESFLIDLKLKA